MNVILSNVTLGAVSIKDGCVGFVVEFNVDDQNHGELVSFLCEVGTEIEYRVGISNVVEHDGSVAECCNEIRTYLATNSVRADIGNFVCNIISRYMSIVAEIDGSDK